jgi:hypothetical protein
VPPPPIDDASPAAGKAGKVEGRGESFAQRLGEPAGARPEGPPAPAQVEAPPAVQSVIDDLRAGRITADQAVSRIVEDTVTRRVGAQAPEAVRQRLRAALTDLVAADPHLRDLVRQMERKLT